MLLFPQRGVILEDGLMQVVSVNCVALNTNGNTHIQFPRSFFIGDLKYIIHKYSVETDTVYYKPCDYDPWLDKDSPHFKGTS